MATAVQIELVLDDKGVIKGFQQIGQEVKNLPAKGQSAFTELTKQQKQAREASQLLSNALGVQVPAGLEKVLAKSKTLGPVLASAFNVTVIAAFVVAAITAVASIYNQFIQAHADYVKIMNDSALRVEEENDQRSQAALGRNRELQLKVATNLATDLGKIRAAAAQDEFLRGQEEIAAKSHNDRNSLVILEHQKELIRKDAAQQEILLMRRIHDEQRVLDEQALESGLHGEKLIMQQITFAAEQAKTAILRATGDRSAAEDAYVSVVQAGLAKLDEVRAADAQKSADLTNQTFDFKRQRELEAQQFTMETAQIERDAAVESLPEWQRANAGIVADFQRSTAEINLIISQRGDVDGRFAARKIALEQQANARIADENRRLVEQMGQDLNDVFDGHIADRIKANAKKLFFQIIAQWFLATKSGGGLGAFGNLLGSLIFGPGNQTGQVIFGGGGGGGAPAGGTFGGGSMGGGGIFSLLGLGGAGAAAPGAGAGVGGGLLAPLGAAASGGASSGVGGVISQLPTLSLPARAAASGIGGTLGGLAGLGIGAAAIGAPILGGKLGGGLGTAGGAISSLVLLAAAGNPSAIALLGALGPTALTLAGPLAGGLVGFGVGEKHGPIAGGIVGGVTGFATGALASALLLTFNPLLAIIGGIVGALGGIFGGILGGSKRKRAANSFVEASILPQIKGIEDQFFDHQLDFATANQDLLDLKKNAEDQLKKLQGEGKDVFRNRVSPAIDKALSDIKGTEAERERRLGLQAIFGPPQFHSGGYVTNSRSFATGPGEIFAKLKVGEYVVNPGATARNRDALERMNNGLDAGGEMHVHVHAWDGESVDRWMRNGGARKIKQHLQRERLQYGT
jgi:hypothetical protein